jgi:DMSO/TMAO reductase YedYZ molybdopterin-dependent catalytic subunit
LLRGFTTGAVVGLAALALMYIASALFGFQPLPEALQQPLLNVLPGPVFGFLIDTLQHAGKVLEEFSIIVGLVVLAGVAGAAWARFRRAPAPGAVVPVDEGRRQFLTLGVGAASLAVLGVRLVPGWAQSIFHPAEAGLSGALSPEVTPAGNFYVVSKNFVDPTVAAAGWRLAVDGLADNPLSLDYPGLQALPATIEYVTLECISNDVGGDLMSTGRFKGVSLAELVSRAGPQASAAAVNFTAADGYTETLPLATVRSSPQILVAYELDGAPLPSEHGFPARILIPGHYGMKGPKWLQRIELAVQPQGGYWEGEGWDPDAVVRTTSRIDVPANGSFVTLAGALVGGVAFAGARGISAVDVSFDGGRTWSAGDVQAPLSPYTWVIWRRFWKPSAEGSYTLVVRARDGGGALQSAAAAGSFPAGASGYHAVQVTVGK